MSTKTILSDDGSGNISLYLLEAHHGDFPARGSARRMKLRFHPTDEGWTEPFRGKVTVSAKDDGDDIAIKLKGGPKFKLDYSQLHVLRILLNELNKDDSFTAKEFAVVDEEAEEVDGEGHYW